MPLPPSPRQSGPCHGQAFLRRTFLALARGTTLVASYQQEGDASPSVAFQSITAFHYGWIDAAQEPLQPSDARSPLSPHIHQSPSSLQAWPNPRAHPAAERPAEVMVPPRSGASITAAVRAGACRQVGGSGCITGVRRQGGAGRIWPWGRWQSQTMCQLHPKVTFPLGRGLQRQDPSRSPFFGGGGLKPTPAQLADPHQHHRELQWLLVLWGRWVLDGEGSKLGAGGERQLEPLPNTPALCARTLRVFTFPPHCSAAPGGQQERGWRIFPGPPPPILSGCPPFSGSS